MSQPPRTLQAFIEERVSLDPYTRDPTEPVRLMLIAELRAGTEGYGERSDISNETLNQWLEELKKTETIEMIKRLIPPVLEEEQIPGAHIPEGKGGLQSTKPADSAAPASFQADAPPPLVHTLTHHSPISGSNSQPQETAQSILGSLRSMNFKDQTLEKIKNDLSNLLSKLSTGQSGTSKIAQNLMGMQAAGEIPERLKQPLGALLDNFDPAKADQAKPDKMLQQFQACQDALVRFLPKPGKK